jgi:chemotaxis signal transduction protein
MTQETQTTDIIESAAAKKNSDTTIQYLSFVLSKEEYGVDILRVQEIRQLGTCFTRP